MLDLYVVVKYVLRAWLCLCGTLYTQTIERGNIETAHHGSSHSLTPLRHTQPSPWLTHCQPSPQLHMTRLCSLSSTQWDPTRSLGPQCCTQSSAPYLLGLPSLPLSFGIHTPWPSHFSIIPTMLPLLRYLHRFSTHRLPHIPNSPLWTLSFSNIFLLSGLRNI